MYYIGIDLGGTNIAAGIVDKNYSIIVKGSIPTNPDREPELIVKDMAALCKKIIGEAGLTIDDIEYAGIATPGTANRELGVVEYANNLPFLNFPIAAVLEKELGIKHVLIENDANAAAKGESVAGVAKGAKYSVMITLGTGVGGGIIIEDKVYSGFNFAGAELGHIVIEYEGKPCSCGRNGCWESYSSATGLISMTRDKILECRESGCKTLMEEMIGGEIKDISGKTAFAAMKKGDQAGAEVVDKYIGYLACGITNIINIFQPEILVIGGGICNEGDHLLIPLNEKVFKNTYTREGSKRTKIKIAKLGNDAGIIGAAALGI